MLLNLREYHRPAAEGDGRELERALALLARPDIRTVPLAGGDTLLGSADSAVEAVVDLQGLGLDLITEEPGGRWRIGAMVTRATLGERATHFASASHVGQIIAEGARRWGGSVQRNRATVGGALAAAAADDPLVVALLACDAHVTLYGLAGSRLVPIADFLPHRADPLAAPALITEVILPRAEHPTGASLATVARTPADAPIVAAAAVLAFDGDRCVHARLAFGGVAETPIRLPEVEALLTGHALTSDLLSQAVARAAELIHPAGDFRGSAEYRKAMAGVLAERALRQAWDKRAEGRED